MKLELIPRLKHLDSDNFFLLAGPCAIEGEEMALRIAERVVEITDRLQIPHGLVRRGRPEVRQQVEAAFAGELPERRMRVDLISFGFKRGVPRVVDLLFDVRFLPNPHWVPELRPQTGCDSDVRDYVLGQPDAGEFIDRTR